MFECPAQPNDAQRQSAYFRVFPRQNDDEIGLTCLTLCASKRKGYMTLVDKTVAVLLHEALTERIIGVFFTVHRELGHGFLESVYEAAMLHALADGGMEVRSQVPTDVWFRGKRVGVFKADLVLENAVIVELKAVRSLASSHEAQLLNALRATNIEVGLLLNFGQRPTFKRLVFANSRKHLRVHPRHSGAPGQAWLI